MKARLAMWWLMALFLAALLPTSDGYGSNFSSQFVSVGFTKNNNDLPHDEVRALAVTPDGLWVGMFGGGLARFHRGQWQTYTTKNSALPHDEVRALAATSDGLWVGTGGRGLARFHQGQWQTYTTKNSALPDDEVWALAATPDGLWVGAFGKGLAYFRPGPPPEITAL